MKRWRGSETIRGEDVRKLLEQVGDTLPGERRAEHRKRDVREEGNEMAGEPGEESLKTF